MKKSSLIIVLLALLAAGSSHVAMAEDDRTTACNDGSVEALANASKSFDDVFDAHDKYLKCLRSQGIALVDGEGNSRSTEQLTAIATAKEESIAKAVKSKEETKNKQDFLGFKWGLGVGASFGLGPRRIESAELVNGLVRVTDDVSDSPRIVLEIHNFVNQWALDKRTIGHGPFAAVNFGATDGDTLTAFGVGYMLGIKRKESSGSFNIGIGLMLDEGVKQLGSGISDGMALPDGETEIRFKEESELAWLLFVSTTFD